MKRNILPIIGLVIGLTCGAALSQTILQSLQLSQDPRGPVQIDTSNNIYFPGHMLNSQTPAPTIVGAGSPTIVGTDNSGTVTGGTSSTGINLTFSKAFLAAPNCVVSGSSTAPTISNAATTGIIISHGASTAQKIFYMCSGQT